MTCRSSRFQKLTILICLYVLLSAEYLLANDNKTIRLAGTHWCPYSCDYQPFPGFVTQYITALLEKQGYHVSVDIMDWQTAIKKTHQGVYDGLITAAPEETKGLILTTTPTDIYHSCFYSLSDSNWHYKDINSLHNKRLGVITNYAYGSPLDEWLNQKAHQSQIYTASGEPPLKSLVTQLESGEIDAFIQDRYVLSHFLYRSKHQDPVIKEAGCLRESPFYLAFSPQSPHTTWIIDFLNNNIDSDKNRQLKHYFKLRYGLGRYF